MNMKTMTTMKTTSALIAVGLGKVCGMVQVAKRAKELVGIQSNTGTATMTKEREALALALEALEANQPVNYCMNNNGEKFPMMQEDPFKFERNTKAITAIKEALAQPEQEPVAWRNAAIRVGEDLCSVGPFGYYDMTAEQWLDWALSVVTVHAPPPQRKPLTDEQIHKASTQAGMQEHYMGFHSGFIKFARAIEAAHGIKE